MITAEEARQRVINLKKKPEVIERILKEIERCIIVACDSENTSIIYEYNVKNDSQTEFVIEELQNLGYNVKTHKSEWFCEDILRRELIYKVCLTISW